MTATRQDEKVAAYLALCGAKRIEGYGFFWSLLEVVASTIDAKSNCCTITYPLTTWSRLLYCHHHSVGKYIGNLEVTGIVTCKWQESNLQVTIPNILKYRDEYSRKSGQHPESVRTKEQIQSKIQIQSKDIPPTPFPKTRQKQALTSEQKVWFAQFWGRFWRRTGKGAAEDSFRKGVVTAESFDAVMVALELQSPGMLQREPNMRPMPSTWLNQRRWEDDPEEICKSRNGNSAEELAAL
jgi:hypothetical protein